jgi:hypothetical protein
LIDDGLIIRTGGRWSQPWLATAEAMGLSVLQLGQCIGSDAGDDRRAPMVLLAITHKMSADFMVLGDCFKPGPIQK